MVTRKPNSPLRLAVLISGGGRTLMNIQDCIRLGRLNAEIVQVISSRADVVGVERAQAAGLPTTVVDRKSSSDAQFQEGITRLMHGADLVCMAGFLSLWHIPDEFAGRVINIHPALLPDFGGIGMYGLRVHRAVLAAGLKESGCTVHYCDNEYDHGSIILQRRIPVLAGDTPEILAARVFEQECVAYPEAIEMFASGQINLPAR